MYKQIASVESDAELAELKVELIDRFGVLPDATKNLLKVSELKLDAAKLKVKKIEAHEKGGYIEFYPDADINQLSWLNYFNHSQSSSAWKDLQSSSSYCH